MTGITKHDVTVILKKAEALGEDDVAEVVLEKYDELIYGVTYMYASLFSKYLPSTNT